jgi:hypothetical protein
METIIGFIAGYLIGTREGREGLDRLRSSWHSIRTSPEVRKLAGEAMPVVEAVVRQAASGRSGLSLKGLGAAAASAAQDLGRRAGNTSRDARAA